MFDDQGMPVCEICDNALPDFYEVRFDGSTYHWSCMYVCADCGDEFKEGQPKMKDDDGVFWIHERDEDCIPLQPPACSDLPDERKVQEIERRIYTLLDGLCDRLPIEPTAVSVQVSVTIQYPHDTVTVTDCMCFNSPS